MNFKSNFCLTILLIAAFAFTSYGQRAKAPQNVLEYFMAVPTKYFDMEKYAGPRKQMVKIKDLANGYLGLEFPGVEGYGEVALFKSAGGTKTLGILTASCGPVCETGKMIFVRYKNGGWIDVTRNVLPQISRAELERVQKCYDASPTEGLATYYELPRFGTTVKLFDNADSDVKLLYEFTWNGTKFIARAKRDKACREQ